MQINMIMVYIQIQSQTSWLYQCNARAAQNI